MSGENEQKDPPRLVDDPDVGEALRAFRDGQPAPSAERLAANRAALDARIGGSSPGAPRWMRWGGAAGAGLLAIAVMVVAPRFVDEEVLPVTPIEVANATPVATAMSSAAPTTSPVAAATATPALAVAPPATEAVAASTTTPASSGIPGSTLAEELRLYEEARAAAASESWDESLERLEELARRFPRTQLAPEAAVTRAEVLLRSGRGVEAQRLLESLVADPVHAGRRSELLRALGDLLRERGDCSSARARYRAALDAGATGEEASAARRGIGACAAE